MDLFVNHYNKFLISADAVGRLVVWDFYAGNIEFFKQF